MLLQVPRIEVGEGIEETITFIRDRFDPLLDAISWLLLGPAERITDVLLWLPPIAMAVLAAGLSWSLRSWQFAVFTLLAFLLIDGMAVWEEAMATIALVVVATFVALLLGIPLGILASRYEVVRLGVRPVLDFMQTLPVFVYLIPAIFFFGIGIVPGLVATLIFAMPPGVRLTELGIRQVDEEVVEAARAFGASPNTILFRVQLPLALPTILAGVNQVILLALSMVVIAGLAGAGGLGGVVVRGISRLDIGLGFEGGIAVVAIAIFLDRITESAGRRVGLRTG